LSPIGASSSKPWRSSTRSHPVAASHLDEVPEPFGVGHRRAGKVTELPPVGHALEDHLAGRVSLAQHAANLAEEAECVRLRSAMPSHPLEDLLALGQRE
jgi:hypothetical protein